MMKIDIFKKKLKQDNHELYIYVRKQKIKKVFKIFLLDLLIITLFGITIPNLNDPDLILPSLISAAVCCLFPPLFTKPKNLLFGKSWIGTIKDIKCKIVGKSTGGPRTLRYREFVYIILYVKDENGKKRELLLERKYEPCYSVGDKIAHYNGVQFPIILHSLHKNKKIVCSRCGTIFPGGEPRCVFCNMSFFDF